MRFLAAGVVLCFLLAACSTSSSDDTADGATTALPAASPSSLMQHPTSPPVPNEVPVGEVGTMFDRTPELVRASSTPFESWSQVSPNTIAIHFVTGTPECYGADAIVTESDTEVLVHLRTGTLPGAANKACIMVAVYGTMQLTLGSPVGERKILNAS